MGGGGGVKMDLRYLEIKKGPSMKIASAILLGIKHGNSSNPYFFKIYFNFFKKQFCPIMCY